MEITQNTFQKSKNRKRLIAQNHKLYQQVANIHEQIKLLQPESSHLPEPSQVIVEKSVLEEIALQKKLIMKLRGQIQQYKLERAKDNVEYIIRQEDELKIAKKLEFQLMDEKNILMKKKADKSIFLQKEVPYQNYEKQFLQNLAEVVHFNREQAAKITQIEREIRKYHLIKKSKKFSPQKVAKAQNLQTINKEIQEKVATRMNLERQWKPHLVQLDEENASFLRQLAIKKQELAVMEKQQRSWEIRLSGIRESEDVKNDKERLQKVKVNHKLKQKILDYMQKELDKKKKKVNEEQLKYQFVNKTNQQQKLQDNAKASLGPPLPGMKKKDEKVIETMHNDKNITKKIDKSTAKKQKNDQNTITQISVPSSKQTINKIVRRDSLGSAIKSKLNNEERTPRYWQSESPSQVSSQRGQEKTSKKNAETSNLLLKLKEIGITTEPKLWDGQIMQSVVQ